MCSRSQTGSQWWCERVVQNADGKPVVAGGDAESVSLVPANYVREMTAEEDALFKSQLPMALLRDHHAKVESDLNGTGTLTHQLCRARALYDFDGDPVQQFFRLPQVPFVLPDDTAQWWDASQRTVLSLVPHNYVEIIEAVETRRRRARNRRRSRRR